MELEQMLRQTREAGHCLDRSGFVRVSVSGKSENNELPWIRSKLCRYDLGNERN
jgi:hypothetical protein